VYTDNTNTFAYSYPIAVDNTGGAAGSSDVQVVLPTDLDLFWTTVQSDGDDVRLVDADGKTLLVYQLSAWVYATRSGTIQIDNYALPAGEMCQIWLVWGNSSVSSAAGSFVAGAVKTGYIAVCAPLGKLIPAIRENFRAQRPRAQLQKASGESIFFTLDVREALGRRRKGQPWGGDYRCEEIDYVSYRVTLAGAAQGAMIDEAKIRFYPEGPRLYLTAGSDGSEYTVEVTVVTTELQTLIFYVWLSVRNADES
jgi:hypothetical protein